MAKNVQCCYCQNLGIRFDEDHEPYDWCDKVTDSPDPLRERECEYYERLVPPTPEKDTMWELGTCPLCGGKMWWFGGNYACMDCHHIVIRSYPIELDIPQTNGDRIRGMSDYEMAEWIADILNHCDNKKPEDECLESCPLYACCNLPFDNIENWLKSPVKDGEA